jgi:hypothetical protein
VIDLKVREFEPEYAGKMNFYLSSVDELLRRQGDAPSIGLILCKGKGKTTVEYALRDTYKPIGVSSYQHTLELPHTLQRVSARRQDLLHRTVAEIGDEDVAAAVHRHADGLAEAAAQGALSPNGEAKPSAAGSQPAPRSLVRTTDQQRQDDIVAFEGGAVRDRQEFFGLLASKPVPQPGSLLADVGDVGQAGRLLRSDHVVPPGFADQLAHAREPDVDRRRGK